MVGQALISRMEEPEGQRLGNGTGPLEAVNLVTIGECGTGMTDLTYRNLACGFDFRDLRLK